MVGQYFPKRFAVAIGICFVGNVITIAIVPIILQASIDAYGWRGAYLILTGYASHVFIACALLKPLPTQNTKTQNKSVDNTIRKCPTFSHLCRMVFWDYLQFTLLLLSLFFWNMAHFSAVVLIQPRAVFNGVGTLQQSAFVISLIGMSSLVTRVGTGFIVQRGWISTTTCYIIGIFIAGTACSIPYFTYTYATICAFSVILGLAIGIYITQFMVCARQYMGKDRFIVASAGCLLVSGLGALICPPLAGRVFDITQSYDTTYYILGAVFAISGLICIPGVIVNRIKNKTSAAQANAQIADTDEHAQSNSCEIRTIGVQVDETEWIHKSDISFILDSPLAYYMCDHVIYSTIFYPMMCSVLFTQATFII